MSVSYDEFKEGLKQSGIPISPAQIDALIAYLDRDGDGEIDFRYNINFYSIYFSANI
jgi:Ca2+-binding EF-hand superfamily protein